MNQLQLAGILRLALIQRPETDGRRIQNYDQADGMAKGMIGKIWKNKTLQSNLRQFDTISRLQILCRMLVDSLLSEVLEFVRGKFADTLRVKEVEGLAHGTPWIEQFRQFHDAETCPNLKKIVLITINLNHVLSQCVKMIHHDLSSGSCARFC